MPIKNYTSKMPVSQSLSLIQEALINHGAIGFLCEYEKGTGRIEAVRFLMEINEKKVGFSLPINWRLFQAVLKRENVKRWDEDDYCYRVAWANLRDLVLAQMAYVETEMIEIPQMFLGHAVSKNGKTLYDQMKNNQLLLE
jgi:hypothetical protein